MNMIKVRGLRPALRRSGSLMAAGMLMLLAACTGIEIQNKQAAQQLAQQAKPPGSVYTGWRIFQDRCAGCHGVAAGGSVGAPDLLPRVREMGAHRFTSLVLKRYDWNLPPAQQGAAGSTAGETLLNDIVQGKQGALTMPAWQGEPVVSAHIIDLYAYLSARAAGTQGPGRPVQ
jgi:mono/diheme cytochrome c family protein